MQLSIPQEAAGKDSGIGSVPEIEGRFGVLRWDAAISGTEVVPIPCAL